MREKAYRKIGETWTLVTAREVAETKIKREKFRDKDNLSLMLRHHGGEVTPHFEIEPRWNE
jgi:hypothetical protein